MFYENCVLYRGGLSSVVWSLGQEFLFGRYPFPRGFALDFRVVPLTLGWMIAWGFLMLKIEYWIPVHVILFYSVSSLVNFGWGACRIWQTRLSNHSVMWSSFGTEKATLRPTAMWRRGLRKSAANVDDAGVFIPVAKLQKIPQLIGWWHWIM